MNAFQYARQIQKVIADQTWVDSPSEYVFGRHVTGTGTGGSVIVTDGPEAKALVELRRPLCLVTVGNNVPDEEHPDLELQEFDLILVTEVMGDDLGERVLLGGPRPSAGGQGSSRGRGLLEVEERVKAACGRLSGADGCPAALACIGSPPSQKVDTGFMVSSRKYRLRAWCTRQATFDAPTSLLATGGVGSVTLSWALPPARWDRRQIVLRKASGATAPASATAGTGVTLSGDLATSVVDTVLAGTWSYAVFCGYTETGAAANERFSAQSVGATRTVVAT